MPAVFSHLPAALTDLLSPPHFLINKGLGSASEPRGQAHWRFGQGWERDQRRRGPPRKPAPQCGENPKRGDSLAEHPWAPDTTKDLRLTVCPLFSCSFQNPTLVLSKMMVLAINSVNWSGFLSLCLFSSPVNLQGINAKD